MADSCLARELLREASLELARLRRIRGASHKTWRRIARAQARLAFAAALLGVPLAEPALAVTPRFQCQFSFAVNSVFFLTFTHPAFSDIDADGDSDLFIGTEQGGTAFFENTGTPSEPCFGPASPSGLADVGSAASPDFTDLDGDGDLDALVGNGDGNTVFFRNTGTASAPSFSAPSTNPFGLADVGRYASPEFTDLDGDGDLDAFVANSDGNTIHFENTGTASAPAFAAPVTNPFGLAGVGPFTFITSPTFVDVDGDGDFDAFIGAGNTYFFENTGTASAPAFAAPSTNPFGLGHGGYSASPAFADIDGDGDLDALVGAYAGKTVGENLQAFENTGTASTPAFVRSDFAPLAVTDAYSSPAFGDVDGDGDLDAFVGQRYGNTRFFRNTGTAGAPSFGPVGSLNPFGLADVGAFASPDLVDIDSDADLDAFVGASSGYTLFFQNTGTTSAPAFAAASFNPFGLTDVGFYASPALVDIDGDGDLDAFVGRGDGRTLFFRNTGSAGAPAFAPPSTSPFGLADVGLRAAPAFADVDGDGDLDALVGAESGDTFFFANTGSTTSPAFAGPSTNPFGLADVGAFASPTLADLDADDDLDALVGEYLRGTLSFENFVIDPEACTDGLDNDSDGLIDLGNDPGCANAGDTSELSARQCDNGLDDDGDGKIDWRSDGSGDPECMAPRGDREAPPPPSSGCGLGPELLFVASLLAALRRVQRVPDGLPPPRS